MNFYVQVIPDVFLFQEKHIKLQIIWVLSASGVQEIKQIIIKILILHTICIECKKTNY